jgi:tetratricopeptide (TPR) repeat protein
VIAIDPNYIDARLVQGLHDYIVGSLPWHLKIITTVVGVRGDREEGINTLKLVATKGNTNKYDAQALLAAIYRREKRPLEALPLINGLAERFPRNYLFRMETVQMYGDAGDKASALAALAKAEELKTSGAKGYQGLPVEKIWYTRGNLLFWYRDFDAAIDQFRRVTPRASSLDQRTAAMMWLRLGQSLDMKERRTEALNAYRQVDSVAPESEAAKQSRRYMRSPYRRSG